MLVDSVGVGLQELVDKDYHKSHDNQLHDDTHTVRNGVSHHREHKAGKACDDGHGEGHDKRSLHLDRYSEGGADTQHKDSDRVALENRVKNRFFEFFVHITSSLIIQLLGI